MVVMVGFFGRARADEPLLSVGVAAPEVVGTDAKGTSFKLSAQKGRFAIVYFYPKATRPAAPRRRARSATRSTSSSRRA